MCSDATKYDSTYHVRKDWCIMMSLELKKSYFEELFGKTMSQNYEATEVRTNMSLMLIRELLNSASFTELSTDDVTVTLFIKDRVRIIVTTLTSFMTVLDVEILPEIETVKETGEVVCCFNCAGYDQEDGFCNYHERYKDEQEKCRHFEPNNG